MPELSCSGHLPSVHAKPTDPDTETTYNKYRRWKENLDQEASKNVQNGYIHEYIHEYIHGYVHGYVHGYIHGDIHGISMGYTHGHIHGDIHGYIHGYILFKHFLRLPGLGFLSIYGRSSYVLAPWLGFTVRQ